MMLKRFLRSCVRRMYTEFISLAMVPVADWCDHKNNCRIPYKVIFPLVACQEVLCSPEFVNIFIINNFVSLEYT